MRMRLRFCQAMLFSGLLVLGACGGGSYDARNDDAPPTELPAGGLMNALHPGLYEIGATYAVTYEVQKSVDPWYFSDLFEITETRTVLGNVPFGEEDEAVEVAIAVRWNTTASGGEHEEFTGDFKAYYALDFEDSQNPRVRYLGSTRQNPDTLVFEPWETADPAQAFRFALLQEGESFEQMFTLTTDGEPREKTVVMTFAGGVTSQVPGGDIVACRVVGTGFEPLLYKTTEDTPFEVHLAVDTGLPVFIQFVEGPTEWTFDPTVRLRLVSASLNGVPVHGEGS